MSVGSLTRRIGILGRISSPYCTRVCVAPGATAFTLMLWAASSLARPRVNDTTPAFDTEYGDTPPAHDVVAMLTIFPDRRSIIPGTASCEHRNVPRRLIRMVLSHESSVMSASTSV